MSIWSLHTAPFAGSSGGVAGSVGCWNTGVFAQLMSDVDSLNLRMRDLSIALQVDHTLRTATLSLNGSTHTFSFHTQDIPTTAASASSRASSPFKVVVSAESPPSAPVAGSSRGVSLHRLHRAAAAGRAAQQYLTGRTASLLATPPITGESAPRDKIHVVLSRGANLAGCGEVINTPALFDLVGDPPRPGAIFHSFASQEEVQAYWLAAGRELPVPFST